MNSLILISPSKTWGFQPILSGNNSKLLDNLSQKQVQASDLSRGDPKI
ncbi:MULTISPECIES: hypothetical protein [unclassified Microcoleus]|nr:MULTISPECIES: hypothetical protein [unclassified Microcoleus]